MNSKKYKNTFDKSDVSKETTFTGRNILIVTSGTDNTNAQYYGEFIDGTTKNVEVVFSNPVDAEVNEFQIQLGNIPASEYDTEAIYPAHTVTISNVDIVETE